MDTIYGGDIYGENKIAYINGEEIDLSSFDSTSVVKIIEYSNSIIEDIIEESKSCLITKKKKDGFISICNKLLKEDVNVKNNIDDIVNNKSFQFLELIINIFYELYSVVFLYVEQKSTINKDNIDYYYEEFASLCGKIKNLPKLAIISNSLDDGIIIFGKNGSGKSKFMSFLMKIYNNNMVLIPAQKLLYYSKSDSMNVNSENDITLIQHKNLLDTIYGNDFDLRDYSRNYTKLISHVANQTMYEQNKIIEKIVDNKKKKKKNIEIRLEETLLDKINNVWCELIPNIIFKLNTNEHCIYPYNKKSGNSYSLNLLSDGEKIVLYYICSVILAEKNQYIVIDEPETYLNPAVYIDTWNLLEKIRPDCQFIYISHELDFINSRNNNKLVWMKSYVYPDNWDFVPIENNLNIPNDLIVEIYGSKNKILFCEGDKNQKDYRIYEALFGDKYTIIPVGGCHTVIDYTKSINKTTKEHGKSAIGIVDNDNRSGVVINNLSKSKIFVTVFNEIEMLLCDEKILERLTRYYENTDAKAKIENFKDDFYKCVQKRKDKIAFNYIRESINNKLESHKINSKNVTDIEGELQSLIESLKINEEYNNYINKINKIIDDEKYDKLIAICNLKNEIVNGLGEKIIINNYSEQAIGVIKKELKQYIKKKYFRGIDKF